MLEVKNPPAKAGEVRHAGLIPGLGRPPEEGNGNPLQSSCLGNSMDRGTSWATVHGVAKSQTRLKQLGMHTPTERAGTFFSNWSCRVGRRLRLKPNTHYERGEEWVLPADPGECSGQTSSRSSGNRPSSRRVWSQQGDARFVTP